MFSPLCDSQGEIISLEQQFVHNNLNILSTSPNYAALLEMEKKQFQLLFHFSL